MQTAIREYVSGHASDETTETPDGPLREPDGVDMRFVAFIRRG
ncbi:MAG: hypothetical protein Q7J82_03745 [Coriobacteriia bacterium]|nr:hypothetical protein [Coriobacteriia bacterium]